MDKLSIIIPAYIDTEAVDKKFRALLEELFRQKKGYRQTEIIVIDDGSLTAYRERAMLDCYINKDIYVSYHAKPEGVSCARNHGLDCATGNLIAFCDADDGVEPDYLDTIYKTFAATPRPRAVVFDNDKTSNPDLAHELPNLAVWSYAFTKEAIGNERFDETKQVGEDYDWLGRVWKGDGLLAVPKRIYNYDREVNPNSLSKQFNRGEIK